ncbi:hypothetical protein MN608_06123 [Microdochium nivale]|nr:hypothetical protein MN608_06123 [Microdochium nivale]
MALQGLYPRSSLSNGKEKLSLALKHHLASGLLGSMIRQALAVFHHRMTRRGIPVPGILDLQRTRSYSMITREKSADKGKCRNRSQHLRVTDRLTHPLPPISALDP